MLTKFRTHHIKRILWVLVVVIVPAFILWGGLSYFRERKSNIVCLIGDKKINIIEFNYYINMAKIHFAFIPKEENKKPPTEKEILNKAYDFLLFLWKANKEKIDVKEEEIVDRIKNIFSKEGKFDNEIYLKVVKSYFRMEPSNFEDYIKSFLKIEKLIDKYVNVEVREDEVIKIYKKDNQKAKISYLFLPYEKIIKEVNLNQREIENFYNNNKNLFSEEKKIKIKYTVIAYENVLKDKILEELHYIKDIEELKNKFSLEIKETDFFGKKDPIEGLGWQLAINDIAFGLKIGQISSPLETNLGYLVIEKVAEKEPKVFLFDEVKNKVEEELKKIKAKEIAKKILEEILEKIKKDRITDIKKIPLKENFEFKETNYFKYYDYIEGLGLSESLSKAIFSLKKGRFYPYPILTQKGAYIVQLIDLTSFDKKDFEEKKEKYTEDLKKLKRIVELIKFRASLIKEANFKIYPL